MSEAAGSADRRPDRATFLAFTGVVLFGGVNAIGVHETVKELAPLWGAAVRFLAAGLLLLAIVLLTRRALPSGRSLVGAILYGAVGFAASFGCIYPSLRELPPGPAQVLIALTPLFTFGLAIVQRQERYRAQGLAGAVIALAGVSIVVLDELSIHVPLGPVVLVLVGTAAIAESGVIAKSIPRSDPIATNAVAMLAGGAILLAASVAAGESRILPTQPATWLAVGYLVIFGSVVMFTLYLFALQRWTASAVSYSTLLLPLVTLSVGALLGERVAPLLLLGGAVVLVGVYVGAFLRIPPSRFATSSLPECMPVGAEPATTARRGAR